MAKVVQIMHPISKQPELGLTVRLFLNDGRELNGHCTMIYLENGPGQLYWYVKKKSIDVSKIKGWMPLNPART